MNIKLNIYKEDKPDLTISWNNSFEESVIEAVFGHNSVMAYRYGNSIRLIEMDKELEKIINKYLKKKNANK